MESLDPRVGKGWLMIVLAWLVLTASSVALGAERSPPTADHSKFEALQGPFSSAQEVTEACLGCHNEAANQIRETTHWNWTYDHPETGQQLGKRNVINSFCGMVVTNEPRCTSCHVGYGWTDMNQPPPSEDSAVDCLVCHDTTGDYWKFPPSPVCPPTSPASGPAAVENGQSPTCPALPRMSVPVTARTVAVVTSMVVAEMA